MPYIILLVIVLVMVGGAMSLKKTNETNVLAAKTTLTTEDRVTSLERRVAALEKYTGMVKSASSGVLKENFISLLGGSLSASEWTKIPGTDFTFDQSLYGNTVTVSWQGWMDNGYGYVRIYDNTNHRAVDGSEVMVTSGEKSSFYSKNLSIWRGQNQYWIEAKSIAGEVVISSPRLKVLSN